MNAVHTHVDLQSDFYLTQHAWQRMSQRGISPDAVRTALEYGRSAYTRGALVFAIGKNEVRHYRRLETDLAELDGIHVVCDPAGAVLTVYRNRNLRALRKHRTHRPSSRNARNHAP